jgi:hypothetical protein
MYTYYCYTPSVHSSVIFGLHPTSDGLVYFSLVRRVSSDAVYLPNTGRLSKILLLGDLQSTGGVCYYRERVAHHADLNHTSSHTTYLLLRPMAMFALPANT